MTQSSQCIPNIFLEHLGSNASKIKVLTPARLDLRTKDMLIQLLFLFLAAVSAQGLVTAWRETTLKTLILPLFDKELKYKSVTEIEDLLVVKYRTFGQFINCSYCHSPYITLVLFLSFLYIPFVVVLGVTAFLGAPLFVHLVQPSNQTIVIENTGTIEAPEDAAPTYTFTAPPDIQARITSLQENPEDHQAYLQRNQHLLTMLYNVDSCGTNARCRQIVQSYNKEIEQMTKAHAHDPVSCPACVRGSIINKHIFMLEKVMQTPTQSNA